MTITKCLVAVLLFAVVAPVAEMAWSKNRYVGRYVVKRDYGGNIVEYHKKALKLEAASTPVVIDGVCASACTAYLRNACATRRARIGFHSAEINRWARKSRYGDPQRLNSVTAYYNRLMASHYPAKVRRWISRNGGLPGSNSMLWLKGQEAQDVIGAC